MSSAERVPQLPEVPTIAEAGFPGFEGVGWGGLVIPMATPKDLVEIQSFDHPWVVEGEPRHGERHIVLAQVALRLAVVPFEASIAHVILSTRTAGDWQARVAV